MATGAQAIERISEATAIGHHSVSRAARALREANADLWPQGERGGGKNAAHVQSHHLVNLAVALAIADTQADAPLEVERYLALGPVHEMGGLTDMSLLDHPTLGHALKYVVEHIAEFTAENLPPKGNLLQGVFMRASLEVTLVRQGRLWYAAAAMGTSPTDANYWAGPSMLETVPDAAIRRIGVIPFALFEVLAELWADTRDRQRSSPLSTSGLPPASDPTGNENAAPARAAPRQPRANAADGFTNLLHPSSPQGERQPTARDPGSTGFVPTNPRGSHDPGTHVSRPTAA